jgi:hypothetical protein
MSIHTCKKLVVLALLGWGSYFAIQQPLIAGDQMVPVTNPVFNDCDVCGPTLCQSFCYKLRLHCIYARRCCSQKYVLLPTSPSLAPYVCPPPYASPYGQQMIGGYNPPPMFPAPAGVYIR